MRYMVRRLGTALVLVAMAGGSATAQTFNSGSTGADGAFNPTGVTTLALPPDGVFHFTTINIPFGTTVRFTRNATNTPVTMLATGNVTITGNIDIAGANGGSSGAVTSVAGNGGRGGPGGYDGGNGATGFVSTTGGSGQGPGGGSGSTGQAGVTGGAGGAGYVVVGTNGTGQAPGVGGAAYGSATALPLIGGSGGGGGGGVIPNTGGGGGGGGGALLIASSGTITLGSGGHILARGGDGGSSFGNGGVGSGSGGTGGTVRLIATSVTGTGGTINIAAGSSGSQAGVSSAGRLRVEGFSNTLTATMAGNPPAGAVTTGGPTTVTLANGPTIRIASVAGVSAPAAPTGSLTVPDVVLPGGTTSPVAVNIEAANVPLGTVITLTAKGQFGAATSANSSALTGTVAASTASATLAIPTTEPSVISASASFTIVASTGGPVFVEGEEVERVRVAATIGGPTQVAYITKSGRTVILGRP